MSNKKLANFKSENPFSQSRECSSEGEHTAEDRGVEGSSPSIPILNYQKV